VQRRAGEVSRAGPAARRLAGEADLPRTAHRHLPRDRAAREQQLRVLHHAAGLVADAAAALVRPAAHRHVQQPEPDTFTKWTINIPQRTGRALIYSIWQRVVGSEEAFYTCSDVDFGGGGGGNPTPTPTPTPTVSPTKSPTPTPTPTQGGGTWAAGTTYQVGDRVTYAGKTYQCRQAHTAIAGWEPPNVPALWLLVG